MCSAQGLVAGAFSPATLAKETLTASYPADGHADIYLIDTSRQLLFKSGALAFGDLPPNYPGVSEALGGQNGTVYVQPDNTEHVVAYSPIPMTGMGAAIGRSLGNGRKPFAAGDADGAAGIIPAFILVLVALWFGTRRIVQPLQRLEAKAAALAWGDFHAIEEPVGGISEVQHLQLELTEMARKVQAAQTGLHDYIGAITSAQEEERHRLARELHDDTIQAVIALKQRVQLVRKSVKEPTARRSLNELESLAEETIENLRRLTHALRPIYLEDLGLVTALEMLARETGESNHLSVDFQRKGREQRLAGEVELALYRIAQEALNNVQRHAKATVAALSITFGNEEVVLEVDDNGIGFQVPNRPTEFAPGGHFGLLGMHERAELIGARMEVRSDAGQGTAVVHSRTRLIQ